MAAVLYDFGGVRLASPPGTYEPAPKFLSLAKAAYRHLPVGGSLLDLGCGVGTISLAVANWAATGQFFGIDINELSVQTARENAEANRITATYEVADVENIPWAGPFDVVTSNLPTDPDYEAEPDEHETPKTAYVGGQFGLETLASALRSLRSLVTPDSWVVHYSDLLRLGADTRIFWLTGFEVAEVEVTDPLLWWGTVVLHARKVKDVTDEEIMEVLSQDHWPEHDCSDHA